MKFKKIVTMCIVGILGLQMLCGCGNGQGNDTEVANSSTGNESENNSGNGTESTKKEGFTEHIYDMGGKTIVIADANWIGGDASTPEKQFCAKVLEEIEKDYNCNIEVIAPNMSTLEQDITTAAAGGKVFANIINFQAEFNSIYDSGIIAEVSTIENLGLDTNAWLEASSGFGTRNGIQYGVGFMQQQCQSLNLNVIAFNKDLAAQYGIEDMYELVRNGEWTFEKFEEICQTITTKSNGTVKGMINGYMCMGFFGLANDVDLITLKDGKYTYNGMDDKMLNALQFCQDFHKKGLYPSEYYFGQDYGLTESNVFMDRKTLFHLSDYWVVSEVFAMGMPDDYGILPYPKGPDAEDYVGIATNARNYCFIKGDPDIEDAAAILVALEAKFTFIIFVSFPSVYTAAFS